MNIAVSWSDINGAIRYGKLIVIVPSIETLTPIAVVVEQYDHKFYCMRVDELTYRGE